MTRDEAIEQVRGTAAAMNASLEICPVLFVESLVALGMLKLDEPKDATEKFLDFVEGFGTLTRQDGARMLANLARNGLKIVEK